MNGLTGFYRSTLGKKVVMAVTGIILFGYVVAHMLGNLQIYLGPEQINAYAEFLHSKPALLLLARLALLFCVLVHIVAAVEVWWRSRQSRPVKYRVFRPPAVDYAAKTMAWSGPIIAAFVVYHILHFTTGSAHPDFEHLEVYSNVVKGFSDPRAAVIYIVANLLLAFHLYHGLWSLFQTMGWDNPRFNPWRRRLAVIFALIIGAANVSIPVSVLTGVVHL